MASSAPPPDTVEVSNPAGTLRIRVSPTGLPVHVQIAPSALSRGVAELAAEVLRLCRRAES
jgi:hypothetical protein